MAKLHRGILGGFSGSVSSVTGIVRNNKSIILSRINKRSDIPTELQEIARDVFKTLSAFISAFYQVFLKSAVFTSNPRISQWNWLMQNNSGVFGTKTMNFPSQLLISFGVLADVDVFGDVYNQPANRITFFWRANSSTSESSPDDVAHFLLYNEFLNEFLHPLSSALRVDGLMSFDLPGTWPNFSKVDIYIYFLRAGTLDESSPTSHRQGEMN